MRTPNYTTQFERDLRLAERRGKVIEKLKTILKTLIPCSATTKAAANATSNPTGCLSTNW
jgi:mRNA-degrading endonuclease YafQ of YafQ-DinJ toxin-antitoxin module